MSQSSRLERVKSSTQSLEGEESTYEHSKLKSNATMPIPSVIIASEQSQSMSKGKGIARKGWLVSVILAGVLVLFVYMAMIVWAPYCLVSKKKRGSLSKTDLCKRSVRRSHMDYSTLFLWSLLVSAASLALFWLLSAITAGIVSTMWGSSKSSKKLMTY